MHPFLPLPAYQCPQLFVWPRGCFKGAMAIMAIKLPRQRANAFARVGDLVGLLIVIPPVRCCLFCCGVRRAGISVTQNTH